MKFERYFTKNKQPLNITKRRVTIKSPDGKEVFAQDDVEAPDFWSDRALAIVASKYFHGRQGSPERESSVLGMVDRVASTITGWGHADGYFDSASAAIFREELYHILIHQKAAFNSPVWFNVGVPGNNNPQIWACLILGIEDTMESITDWYKTESLVFKQGSGVGINISPLRSYRESLSYGGKPSGPLSFMRAADSCAGVVRSGGKVRRAAKLVCMDDNHPDIWEFVSCKVESKKQADALRAAGFTWELGDDSLNIPYTNSNHAIRLTDNFMIRAKNNLPWLTFNRTDGRENHRINAKDLLEHIAEAVHFCGDPGVMFHDTINRWNTCAEDGDIKAANPCIELEFLDDNTCNLASLKLTAFLDSASVFDTEAFGKAIDLLITAQDIMIDRSAYPTEKIKSNSKRYRPLGLGFTDLGAMLMRLGIPYDSDEGRTMAASITSFMTARAYTMSAELTKAKGASEAFEKNSAHYSRVISEHTARCRSIPANQIAADALSLWEELDLDTTQPVRNMQVTLLAPAGTISFALDCDTTGIEPELALVKYKRMVGGGLLRIVNRSVSQGLSALGYSREAISKIMIGLEQGKAPEKILRNIEDEIAVFDCAFKSEGSERYISPLAHIAMVAAVQPHLSGAVSKTINLPQEITKEEIIDLIYRAHEQGIKAVTFYRDGSRYNQPVTSQAERKEVNGTKVKLLRKKLPAECLAYRYKFVVGGEEGYLHMGLFEDGTLGEIFLTLSKEGSTIAGLMDTIATQTSIALQYGVPLSVICEKMKRQRFDPSGITNHHEIHFADSLVDFIGRYLEWRFLKSPGEKEPIPVPEAMPKLQTESAGQLCRACGNPMTFNGKCFTCMHCGESEGCS